MTSKPPRSPQEKKALSYANDRRSVYGNNDKAARKAIPARKAAENRKSRRKAGHALAVVDRLDEDQAAMIESGLRHDIERVGGWTKGADAPLSEFLQVQADRRSGRGLTPTRESEPGDD